jgi:hypothetical protein
MPDLPDDYLTEPEFALKIQKARRTLALWRAARSGPPWTRVGNQILYSWSGYLAYLKSNEQQPLRSPRRRAERASQSA